MKKHQSGNVLIYVLVAIVLFGAITMTFTRQMGQTGVSARLSEDQAGLHATELVQYATAVKNGVEQMMSLSHVQPNMLDFVKPGEAGYDTPPHGNKVHHPIGGGITPFLDNADLYASGSARRGWQVQNATNVSWTYTNGTDVILSFVDVDPQVCAAINQRLYKDPTIPVYSGLVENVFMMGGTNSDFTGSNCTGCAGRANMCVQDTNGVNVFYNVIVTR